MSEFFKIFAELFEGMLVLSRVKFKGTFHDTAVVEVGNVNEVLFFGVVGVGFLTKV